VLVVLAGVERPVRGDPVRRDQGAVQDHVGVSGLLRRPDCLAELRRPGSEQVHGLGHVPPGRGGADRESGRELGGRLAFRKQARTSSACCPGFSFRQHDRIDVRWRRIRPEMKVRVRDDSGSAAR
jgi:hypothetical protein